jgi:hypothetical protein
VVGFVLNKGACWPILAIRSSTCEVAAKRRGVSEKIVGKNLAARAKLIDGASEIDAHAIRRPTTAENG